MVTIVSECARGCQEAAEDGLSTVPAVALDGALLCRSCAARIGWKLDDVPDVATRARMSLIPGGGAQDNERVTASKDLQIPINPVAMETCDAIVLMLGNWCTYWARVLEVRPPQELETALRGERDVESVQAGTSPQAVGDGILEWSRWLKLILPGILAHPAAVAFHDDLCDVVNRAESRFPAWRAARDDRPASAALLPGLRGRERVGDVDGRRAGGAVPVVQLGVRNGMG